MALFRVVSEILATQPASHVDVAIRSTLRRRA